MTLKRSQEEGLESVDHKLHHLMICSIVRSFLGSQVPEGLGDDRNEHIRQDHIHRNDVDDEDSAPDDRFGHL